MNWKLALGLGILFFTSMTFAANSSPAPLKTVAKGAFSGILKPTQLVITNQAQWTDIWKKHTATEQPKKPAPEVDFSKETLLFVGLGQKTTGGYTIEIVEVLRTGGKTEVMFKSKEPKAGGFNLQAFTSPFHIARTTRIEGEVTFKTK